MTQVLGLCRQGSKPWAKRAEKAELAAIMAACPGADGAGLRVLTRLSDELPMFDDEDKQLKRYDVEDNYASVSDWY